MNNLNDYLIIVIIIVKLLVDLLIIVKLFKWIIFISLTYWNVLYIYGFIMWVEMVRRFCFYKRPNWYRITYNCLSRETFLGKKFPVYEITVSLVILWRVNCHGKIKLYKKLSYFKFKWISLSDDVRSNWINKTSFSIFSSLAQGLHNINTMLWTIFQTLHKLVSSHLKINDEGT